MIKAVLFDNDGVLSKWFIPRSEVRMLARTLPNHDIKVGMLSNVRRLPAQIHQAWRAYEGFDVTLLSYREKLSKPNPEYYKLAIKKLGVRPQEILFIDNRAKLLIPAEQLGVKTLHAKSSKQVINGIKGIINKENGIKL